MINMKSKLDERLNTLKSLAVDARDALISMRAIMVEWNEEAFRASVTEDEELVQGLINELRECGFETESLDDGRRIVAELIENLGETAQEMNEAQRELTLHNLFGGTSRHCSECRNPLDDTDAYCPICGSKEGALKPYVEPRKIKCTMCKCGRAFNEEFRFCPSCGRSNSKHKLNEEPNALDIFK